MALKRLDGCELSGYETKAPKLDTSELEWASKLADLLDVMPERLSLVTDSDGKLLLIDRDQSDDIENDGYIGSFFGAGAVLAAFGATHIHAANQE